MSLVDELIQYSEDILDGKIIACQKHKWACQRFLTDLERDNFLYVFDESKAERFLDWMRLFKHRKGILARQLIEPHIIQKFVFGNIYGWVHRENGYRRFNKAYWQVARKNAKSQSLACVGTYETMAFGEDASEVYCAATKSDQAKIVWEDAEAMLNSCKDLQGRYKIAYSRITHPKSGSFMRTLSKQDRKEGDGLNPQCGIIDEYHAHDTTEMYDIIDSGMIARAEPLIMIITTAGHELAHPCYSIEYKYVSQILDPNNPIENDEYFVMINELDKDENGDLIDDIKDEKVWGKANPIACSYPQGVDKLKKRLKIALQVPEKMRVFLTKNMNVWVNAKENGYMILQKWANCGATEENPFPVVAGRKVITGVDLSSTLDLTSVGFEFPLDDGNYAVMSHSFMPEETLFRKMKTDKVPYDLWVKQGWITMTPGAEVDYHFVLKYIVDIYEKNNWRKSEVCFDRHMATWLKHELENREFIPVDIAQIHSVLSYPTKHFRAKVYNKKIIHDNNPVLTWAIGNAVVGKDSNENIKLDKSKSTERIDPITALLNAHHQAAVNEPEKRSVYEDRGIRTL